MRFRFKITFGKAGLRPDEIQERQQNDTAKEDMLDKPCKALDSLKKMFGLKEKEQ